MFLIQARQIHARLRYKGRQLSDEVQRRKAAPRNAAPLAYDVRSPITIRCLSGAAQAGSEYYRWRSAPNASPTPLAGRRTGKSGTPPDGTPPGRSSLSRWCASVDTPACSDKSAGKLICTATLPEG